jgi:prepilin-type N-terminal cleavage/methylation domain-containing protein
MILMRQSRGARGFTLVEIVVVISLLVIVAAAVAPALMRAGREDDVTASANEIAGLIRTARTAGLTRGEGVTLTVVTASGRYVVEGEGDAHANAEPLAEGRLALAAGVTVSADRPTRTFAFDRTGAAAAESLVVHGSGGTMVVGVEGWTGEPYVRRIGVE